MIGVDTNILVRLLTRDDQRQFDAATRLIRKAAEDAPLFVNMVVIAETIWALEHVYDTERSKARSLVAGLLDTVEIMVADTVAVKNWSQWLRSRHRDVWDVVIAGINTDNGCTFTYTFDRQAAKAVPGMELLQ